MDINNNFDGGFNDEDQEAGKSCGSIGQGATSDQMNMVDDLGDDEIDQLAFDHMDQNDLQEEQKTASIDQEEKAINLIVYDQ